jgi:prepilin-type N-terminal cleavage/methylation domain-containing protein
MNVLWEINSFLIFAPVVHSWPTGNAMSKRHFVRFGFTLVELMIVVVILGILAAVAIPAFTRYVKRSKTAEAVGNVQAIYRGEVVYFNNSGERFGTAGFVECPTTPGTAPTPGKYPANVTLWDSYSEWKAIAFSIPTGHYYQYGVSTAGGPEAPPVLIPLVSIPGGGSGFIARAVGDLDGDTTQSTFEVAGGIAGTGEVQRSNLEITDELE